MVKCLIVSTFSFKQINETTQILTKHRNLHNLILRVQNEIMREHQG